MIDQYQLDNGFYTNLNPTAPEAGAFLSFQPSFSYVSSPDITGLTTPDFPTSPVFPGLQDSQRPESYSPESLNSHRRASHARQHSPSASPSYASSPYLTSPTDSGTLTPQPSFYAPIAPRPDERQAAPAATSPRRKRKSLAPSRSPGPSPSSTAAAGSGGLDREGLAPADALLVRLREDDGLAWRDVAAAFSAAAGRDFSVAALQMRLKRLRERARPWTERDVAALRLAHDYWISHKFDIIAAKVGLPPSSLHCD
jgi:hypothetical protein